MKLGDIINKNKFKKTHKLNKLAVLAFVCGGMLLLSGCAGTNRELEKEHIMNNGCFITCRNNINTESKAVRAASLMSNKILATKTATNISDKLKNIDLNS
jgi:hypothetical protein